MINPDKIEFSVDSFIKLCWHLREPYWELCEDFGFNLCINGKLHEYTNIGLKLGPRAKGWHNIMNITISQ